jgi:hypothetical protein
VPVEVQTFEFPFGKARVVIFSDGTPWFVARDVCARDWGWLTACQPQVTPGV